MPFPCGCRSTLPLVWPTSMLVRLGGIDEGRWPAARDAFSDSADPIGRIDSK